MPTILPYAAKAVSVIPVRPPVSQLLRETTLDSTTVEVLALHLFGCPSLCMPVEERTVLQAKAAELLAALDEVVARVN